MLLDELPSRFDDLIQAGAMAQVHCQQVLPHMVQMLVGIDEAGHQGMALGIDALGIGRGRSQDLFI